MNQPVEQMEATSAQYLEHAREINAIAGSALKLETRDASTVAAKVSLGLSLQAAELAGKAILRTLGCSVKQIRKKHPTHDLLKLLTHVEHELQGSRIEALSPYHHFLLWSPTIDGVKLGNSIVAYFDLHFAQGASAYSRSYFYPDEAVFTGPVPIQSLYVIVEYLIQVAGNVLAVTEQ